MKQNLKPIVDKAASEFQGIVEAYIDDVQSALHKSDTGDASIKVAVGFKRVKEKGEVVGLKLEVSGSVTLPVEKQEYELALSGGQLSLI